MVKSRYTDPEVVETARVSRSDVSKLGKFARNGAGAVRVPATIARTGVQTYGGLREFRPDSEVFAADSLASLASVPVTWGHPADGVSPANARTLTIGHVTDTAPETRVKVDGNADEWLRTQLVIGDGDALAQIDAVATSPEVSCGYDCRLEMTSGMHDGQPYDAIQRDIRFNHVAVLPPNERARAGAQAKLRLDGTPIMKIVILDGAEYEVGSEKHLGKLQADHDKALATLQAKLDAAQAKLDAATARADAAASAVSPDALDRAVQERLSLLQVAARHLSAEYTTDGKSNAQIRKDAVVAKHGADKATKSDAYIEAAFDILSSDVKADKADYKPQTGAGAPAARTDANRLDNDNDFRAHLAARDKDGK